METSRLSAATRKAEMRKEVGEAPKKKPKNNVDLANKLLQDILKGVK